VSYNATFRQVKAEDVKIGDRHHWLGRGYQGRTVETITHRCNCEGSARSVDPDTHEPQHYPVIEIGTRISPRDTCGMTSTLIPGQDVTVSDEDEWGFSPGER
jgi:hypothetical protein